MGFLFDEIDGLRGEMYRDFYKAFPWLKTLEKRVHIYDPVQMMEQEVEEEVMNLY